MVMITMSVRGGDTIKNYDENNGCSYGGTDLDSGYNGQSGGDGVCDDDDYGNYKDGDYVGGLGDSDDKFDEDWLKELNK